MRLAKRPHFTRALLPIAAPAPHQGFLAAQFWAPVDQTSTPAHSGLTPKISKPQHHFLRLKLGALWAPQHSLPVRTRPVTLRRAAKVVSRGRTQWPWWFMLGWKLFV